MERDLAIKYQDVLLTNELTLMYVDLLKANELIRKVFVVIGRSMIEDIPGETLGNIQPKITHNGLVQRQSNPISYQRKNRLIDKKHLEKIIQSLLLTGLIYFVNIGTTRTFYTTNRGIQVLKQLYKLEENNSAAHEM